MNIYTNLMATSIDMAAANLYIMINAAVQQTRSDPVTHLIGLSFLYNFSVNVKDNNAFLPIFHPGDVPFEEKILMQRFFMRQKQKTALMRIKSKQESFWLINKRIMNPRSRSWFLQDTQFQLVKRRTMPLLSQGHGSLFKGSRRITLLITKISAYMVFTLERREKRLV